MPVDDKIKEYNFRINLAIAFGVSQNNQTELSPKDKGYVIHHITSQKRIKRNILYNQHDKNENI
jgi:hypothetical protein